MPLEDFHLGRTGLFLSSPDYLSGRTKSSTADLSSTYKDDDDDLPSLPPGLDSSPDFLQRVLDCIVSEGLEPPPPPPPPPAPTVEETRPSLYLAEETRPSLYLSAETPPNEQPVDDRRTRLTQSSALLLDKYEPQNVFLNPLEEEFEEAGLMGGAGPDPFCLTGDLGGADNEPISAEGEEAKEAIAQTLGRLQFAKDWREVRELAAVLVEHAEVAVPQSEVFTVGALSEDDEGGETSAETIAPKSLLGAWSIRGCCKTGDDATASVLKVEEFARLCSSTYLDWVDAHGDPEAQNKAIVGIVFTMQKLYLSATCLGLRMSRFEKRRCRKAVAAALSYLVYRPKRAFQALFPIFFKTTTQQQQPDVALLKTCLLQWSTSPILQQVFEIFCLSATHCNEWDALLVIFKETSVGMRLLAHVTRIDNKVEGPIPIADTRTIQGLKIPLNTYTALLIYLSYQEESKSDIIFSLLPLGIARAFADEIFVNRTWHAAPADVIDHLDCDIIQTFLTTALVDWLGDRPAADPLDLPLNTFLFARDPIFADKFTQITGLSPNPQSFFYPKRLDDKVKTTLRDELWRNLGSSTAAAEKFYGILELNSRIVETYFVYDKRSPAAELLDMGCDARDSVLARSQRMIAEITGCSLTRNEVYLMRILEAFDLAHGIPSELPGLQGSRKTFVQALMLSGFVVSCLLEPVTRGRLPASVEICESITFGDTNESESTQLTYPTCLPQNVAAFLPGWFATQANCAATESIRDDPRQYMGWRSLCLEIMTASTHNLKRVTANTEGMMAPHLDDRGLQSFLELYVDAANPRALHLLTRWTCNKAQDSVTSKEQIASLLERARISKFVLLADAVAQLLVFDDDEMTIATAEKIMQVYIAAEDASNASLFLKVATGPKCEARLHDLYGAKVKEMIEAEKKSKGNERTSQQSAFQHGRAMRWRRALQAVRSFAGTDGSGTQSAIRLFHDLRQQPGGIPDISVANKILHICVTNGRVDEAIELLRLLRSDAHGRCSSSMDMSQYAGAYQCVSPDVVTCNIILKGMQRCRPLNLEEMEALVQRMETPFALGGDGLTPDQVTYNTLINAAITSGSVERGWEWFTEMKRRGIKVDGFTCSILMKQISPSSKPEKVAEILQLLSELDPFDDPVLLSSMVDVYSRLRDFTRLSMTLEAYELRVAEPSPYALATLLKGYGRCGSTVKVQELWAQLNSPSVTSAYILGCALDAFVTLGDLDKAIEIFFNSCAAKIPMPDVQVSLLIRSCTQAKRIGDALNIYSRMRAQGMEPCDVTYNNLMHTCVVSGDVETALSILQDMSANAKHRPDVVTYSTIIKGLCDRGVMQLAMQMFEDLPRQNLCADIVTYNTLLEGFVRISDSDSVESLFRRLLENEIKPSCYTLTILIKFYGRQRKLDQALKLVETLPTLYGFKLDAFVYTATIAACTWNGRVEKALPYLQAMRQSFDTSARTYGTLVAGCIKQQTWPALSVVLSCGAEDHIAFGKRDLATLNDLLREWSSHSINAKWTRGGFDEGAAAQVRLFLSMQKQALGREMNESSSYHHLSSGVNRRGGGCCSGRRGGR